MHDGLETAIRDKTATVAVIGLGYVGIPLIKAFVEAGFNCLGFDIDPGKIEALLTGDCYIEHLGGPWIGESVREGSFLPTADMSKLAECDVNIICVPTPLTPSRDPDLSYVEATTQQIARVLRPGQLIILESTTYPGTTRDIVLPILESSQLRAGEDFFLAYSPEREDPGNTTFTTGRIPKVVGGIDHASCQLAESLYSHVVVQTVPVASCEVAEACKIVENVYRAVNIAMVNELKVLFARMGIDVWEVIDAAKTKPFGFQAFYPGPGLGGHCIPIDPFYLSWLARKQGDHTRFIELAGEINSAMPEYVVRKVAEALNEHRKPVNGSQVGILGVAYKPNVDDTRESPAFRIMELLQARGALLSYNDPHVSELGTYRRYQVPKLSSQPLTDSYLAGLDCLVVATDHSDYDWEFIARHAPLIVDTRNATRDLTAGREKIRKA